jgi:hypothetical protein
VDLNVEPRRDVPQWSETRWNGCWNPDEGVGLYIHMGRFRQDLDMWWAQTVAYLPEGRLAVDRSWGRTPEHDRVRTGNLELRLTEAGWTSSFDGVGELTSIEALARAPRGSSAPSVPMRWEVSAEPVSPVWDMYGGVEETQLFAGDMHVQQGFRTSGTITVGEDEYRLDGVGFKDHSSGVRKWDGFGSHHFTLAVMPGWTLHEIVLMTPDGQARPPLGALFRGEQQLKIERSEMPPLDDPTGAPRELELIVKAGDGEELTLRAELVHGLPMSITEANDNINGVDWEAEGDPIVLIEGIARLTQPDGTVGYAFLERSARRSALRRPVLDPAGVA